MSTWYKEVMIMYKAMPHRWNLKKFLDDHEISRYKLQQKSGLPSNTIYNLCKTPQSIRINTFDKLIPALRELTGNKKITVEDLLVWEESDA